MVNLKELQEALRGEREPRLFAPQKKTKSGRFLDLVDSMADKYKHRNEIVDRMVRRMKEKSANAFTKKKAAGPAKVQNLQRKSTREAKANWWAGGENGYNVRQSVIAPIDNESDSGDSEASSTAAAERALREDATRMARDAIEEAEAVRRRSTTSIVVSDAGDFGFNFAPEPEPEELATEFPKELLVRTTSAEGDPWGTKPVEKKEKKDKKGKKEKKEKKENDKKKEKNASSKKKSKGAPKLEDPWAENSADDDNVAAEAPVAPRQASEVDPWAIDGEASDVDPWASDEEDTAPSSTTQPCRDAIGTQASQGCHGNVSSCGSTESSLSKVSNSGERSAKAKQDMHKPHMAQNKLAALGTSPPPIVKPAHGKAKATPWTQAVDAPQSAARIGLPEASGPKPCRSAHSPSPSKPKASGHRRSGVDDGHHAGGARGAKAKAGVENAAPPTTAEASSGRAKQNSITVWDDDDDEEGF